MRTQPRDERGAGFILWSRRRFLDQNGEEFIIAIKSGPIEFQED